MLAVRNHSFTNFLEFCFYRFINYPLVLERHLPTFMLVFTSSKTLINKNVCDLQLEKFVSQLKVRSLVHERLVY